MPTAPRQARRKRQPSRDAQFQSVFEQLGPGLITGAADDDPSGISTYSVAGAALGYSTLWTALFSFPLMAAIQLMCARLGVVTGRGLAGVIRKRYPRWVLWMSCALLLAANLFNIGADLGGMAQAMQMLTGISPFVWAPLFALGIVAVLIFSSYRRLASTFKYLTLVLFAYVAAAFLSRPDWAAVFRATLVPNIKWTREYMATLVGILGTTISPYLFFWQASQEVEEERAGHQPRSADGPSKRDLQCVRNDVLIGMFFSNLVMYFIILTTGATLNRNGQTHITTAAQAAEALRPVAGNLAYLLFALGLVGTGVLAIPALGGSCAYAISEAAAWRASLNARPAIGWKFYGVLAVSVILGWLLVYAKWDAVQMLFASAVLNGLLAPPLIAIVVLLTSDRGVMGRHVNPLYLTIVGWACAALLALCGAASFAL